MGIDIGKNSFHVVGLDQRGAVVVYQRWTRLQTPFSQIPEWPPSMIHTVIIKAC
jgi:hypothetical protein